MAIRIPLVLDGTGGIQQLQSGDTLSVSGSSTDLESRIALLEWKMKLLLEWMVLEDFELPPELLNLLCV